MNILPKTYKDEIATGHKRRVMVTCFWATFITFTLCSALLLPTYIMTSFRLHGISESTSLNIRQRIDQEDILKVPRQVNQKLDLALSSINRPSIANRIIAITEVDNLGIEINKISYEDTKKGKNDNPVYKILVTGISKSRDSLQAFEKEIEKMDFVKTTSIPVGDFAKFRDLPFTMTIDTK